MRTHLKLNPISVEANEYHKYLYQHIPGGTGGSYTSPGNVQPFAKLILSI